MNEEDAAQFLWDIMLASRHLSADKPERHEVIKDGVRDSFKRLHSQHEDYTYERTV